MSFKNALLELGKAEGKVKGKAEGHVEGKVEAIVKFFETGFLPREVAYENLDNLLPRHDADHSIIDAALKRIGV